MRITSLKVYLPDMTYWWSVKEREGYEKCDSILVDFTGGIASVEVIVGDKGYNYANVPFRYIRECDG
jgi:hypothetical protein